MLKRSEAESTQADSAYRRFDIGDLQALDRSTSFVATSRTGAKAVESCTLRQTVVLAGDCDGRRLSNDLNDLYTEPLVHSATACERKLSPKKRILRAPMRSLGDTDMHSVHAATFQ